MERSKARIERKEIAPTFVAHHRHRHRHRHRNINSHRGQNPSPSCSPSCSTRWAGRNRLPRRKADTYENRTRYANDWGMRTSSRERRNDGHIPTKETSKRPPPFFKQPTAYPDDMTMRCERARRGGAKSKQHTPTARTGRDDTTPCGHENTIPRRNRRQLPAPRIEKAGRGTMR